MLRHIADFAMANFGLVKEGVYFMSENFENGNWVHVDSYLRDDGTRVSEYWRRKYVNPAFANNEPNSLSGGISYEETTFPPNIRDYP